MKVLAVIVTYNPDVELLRRCIESVLPQVYKIVVYDNCSKNIAAICEVAGAFKGVQLFENEENLGLPVHYNRAASLADENGCDWLLLMDQDTVLPSDLITKFSQYTEDRDTAILCPLFRDANVYSADEFLKMIPSDEVTEVEVCISSGSLNRVSTILELGGFDEKLFIDYVDHDYCKNVMLHGYGILQVNTCVIEHRIGDSRRAKILGREIIQYNHAPFRKYYYFRNRVYYARKYHVNLFQNAPFYLGMAKSLFVLPFEEKGMKKLHMALKGMKDGLAM